MRARGRVRRLTGVCRNTREIAAFAERFIGRDAAAPAAPAGPAAETPADPPPGPAVARSRPPSTQLSLVDDLLAGRGPGPELRRFADLQAALASVPVTTKRPQEQPGHPLAEFAVLYPMHAPGGPEAVALPEAIQASLDDGGVLWRWASEDSRAKRAYDITADSVTVSTAHSVKGLDFACVFLLGFDLLETGPRWAAEQIARLTYVAITRARTHLCAHYVSRDALVERMLASV